MVLLDLLAQKQKSLKAVGDNSLELIVAHFDHGIRDNSKSDRLLVQRVAKEHGLQFVYDKVTLGADASELAARDARYDFLQKVKQASKSQGIITAHHHDDVLETAIHNMLRGTGRRGLSSLKSTTRVCRPLLEYNKKTIIQYATSHDLEWQEDHTNNDLKYIRNYIRAKLLTQFSESEKHQLGVLLQEIHDFNQEIDKLLANMLHCQVSRHEIDKEWFVNLPHSLSKEFIHAWCRSHEVQNISKKLIERIVVAIKTGRVGRVEVIDSGHSMTIGKETVTLSV